MSGSTQRNLLMPNWYSHAMTAALTLHPTNGERAVSITSGCIHMQTIGPGSKLTDITAPRPTSRQFDIG
jgi:hypothetical protein